MNAHQKIARGLGYGLSLSASLWIGIGYVVRHDIYREARIALSEAHYVAHILHDRPIDKQKTFT